MERAQTLTEAIRTFSPEPIQFGVNSRNEAFYVHRPDDPPAEFRVQLHTAPRNSAKTYLAGHRGTGKSTELNRLAADQATRKHYEIVHFSVDDVLELTDVDHVDLLVALVARTYTELSTAEESLSLSEGTVEALEAWRERVVEQLEERSTGAGAGLAAASGVGLPSFFARITGRLRYEHTTREVTRRVIEPRIGEFLGHVEDFFLDVQRGLDEQGKRLLVQMQRLLQKACTEAVARDLPSLDLDVVRAAAADLRAELERQLTREDYEILEAVHRSHEASADEATRSLLHSLHLVEYRNTDRWCDVNPLLEWTLERRRARMATEREP